MPTTWFITGASRGLGRELTAQALARGDRVAATLRTPKPLDDLDAEALDRLCVRQLDVTDTVRMGRIVQEAFSDHERIDVVVSNERQDSCSYGRITRHWRGSCSPVCGGWDAPGFK